jgi:hypothetical protein
MGKIDVITHEYVINIVIDLKLSIDLFFKLPVSRFLTINIEGKIGQLTVRRTSSFINKSGA